MRHERFALVLAAGRVGVTAARGAGGAVGAAGAMGRTMGRPMGAATVGSWGCQRSRRRRLVKGARR